MERMVSSALTQFFEVERLKQPVACYSDTGRKAILAQIGGIYLFGPVRRDDRLVRLELNPGQNV